MLDPTAPGDGAPLGFHMIYLPYRDDMRKPQSAMAPRETAPTTEQIDAIDAVITKLTSSNFDSRKIHNPALARYNKMLETIAFDRDAYIPPEDETIVPEEEIMARAGKEIDHAVALLIPRDYDAFTAPKKRKAGSGDGPASRAKKPKVGDVPSSLDKEYPCHPTARSALYRLTRVKLRGRMANRSSPKFPPPRCATWSQMAHGKSLLSQCSRHFVI
mmetsp:Transcript_21619/g.64462  ORF Transcript_21619/g.64462 Transcript_21619/m.64462 type:complete len:216 (-) Transcript_21619:1842-2489(-)